LEPKFFLIKQAPMKHKLLTLVLGTIVSISSIAQSESDLKPFKVDVSLGYAIPGGSGAKGGVLFAIEPKYAVMSNLAVGLRMEAAVVARFSGYDADGYPNNASVKAAGSYLATGDYYFSDNYKFRPFAGAGAGIFSLASAEINSTQEGVSAGSKFGGMIRGGIEVSHFRLGLEYNIVPKTTFTGYDSNGEEAKLTSKNSYIGIKLGVCIGGGPR
jgi:outer membrane protein X